MELLNVFPHLNASLNGLGSILLISGFYFIQRRNITYHRASMIAASSISALFLISYLSHHALRTYYFGLGPTKFTGEGLARPLYFTILFSHTVLAAGVAPFVVWTLIRGLRRNFEKHKKLARLVFPIWLYVSVTGVIVYIFLYQLYPAR